MKIIFQFSMIVALLTSCSTAMFKPPLPTYKEWNKSGVSEEGVKKAMLECGYPDVLGSVRGVTLNDIAKRQNCMFRKGFVYRDGYQGLCGAPNPRKDLPACQNRPTK